MGGQFLVLLLERLAAKEKSRKQISNSNNVIAAKTINGLSQLPKPYLPYNFQLRLKYLLRNAGALRWIASERFKASLHTSSSCTEPSLFTLFPLCLYPALKHWCQSSHLYVAQCFLWLPWPQQTTLSSIYSCAGSHQIHYHVLNTTEIHLPCRTLQAHTISHPIHPVSIPLASEHWRHLIHGPVPVVPAPGCVWTARCLFPSCSRGRAVSHLHHASRCLPDCLGMETKHSERLETQGSKMSTDWFLPCCCCLSRRTLLRVLFNPNKWTLFSF